MLSSEKGCQGHMQLDIVTGDMVSEHSLRPFGRWIRHTASVPKGFLRYYVLRLLKEKPMSGSEIMEEIEKETDGRWKPSPGSIYPLLAWLKDNDYTKELSKEESGIKRYTLTEQGGRFFEEQTKLGERLRRKLELLAPLPLGGFWFSPHSEKLRKIQGPQRQFIRTLFNLRRTLEENLTDQALEEVGEFLNSTTEKIEELCKKLEKGNQMRD
ncbi:MAG: PadR family transcriptional regulator [Candidatus Bathyarchaeota archaeon]|nr:PadR family transcriptional regulator [Candidatus Bathyarchaeota archaeon]